MSTLEQIKAKMTAAIEHFKNDLKNIRTGRANPGMVEHVMVEVYGSPTPLKQIASITCPEPRLIVITPFDPQMTATVGKWIDKANIGFTPIVDGNVVRVKISQMTEDIRKKMVKICHDEREKTKVGIRNIRRDANESVRKQKTNGEIAEDVMKKLEKSIQELTDKSCKEVDDLSEKKEKEISTI